MISVSYSWITGAKSGEIQPVHSQDIIAKLAIVSQRWALLMFFTNLVKVNREVGAW